VNNSCDTADISGKKCVLHFVGEICGIKETNGIDDYTRETQIIINVRR
jgi:hypothetical protein